MGVGGCGGEGSEGVDGMDGMVGGERKAGGGGAHTTLRICLGVGALFWQVFVSGGVELRHGKSDTWGWVWSFGAGRRGGRGGRVGGVFFLLPEAFF